MADENDVASIVEFSVDPGEQEAPQPLPPGDYPATIRDATVRLSKNDTKYAEVRFFVSADHYPADFTEGDPEGETLIFRRVSLEDTPRARFGLRRFLEAIGAPSSKHLDVKEWIGAEALVTVTTDTYQGIDRAQIANVQKP